MRIAIGGLCGLGLYGCIAIMNLPEIKFELTSCQIKSTAIQMLV